jgi:hypothetical protein
MRPLGVLSMHKHIPTQYSYPAGMDVDVSRRSLLSITVKRTSMPIPGVGKGIWHVGFQRPNEEGPPCCHGGP